MVLFLGVLFVYCLWVGVLADKLLGVFGGVWFVALIVRMIFGGLMDAWWFWF